MLNAITDWARLAGAAFRLSRFDALIPSEYAHFAPTAVDLLGKASRIGAKTSDNGRRLRPGERLAAAFEGMGPAYVKLGQFMATRPDIIGFEMAGDLARLQDKMPPFPRSEAITAIEKSFNKPIDDLFAAFSEPIAAASVAQVHRATLKSGEDVAVKVLRPEIHKIATREFRAFARAARMLEMISVGARRMEPVKFIETLKASAAVELDLRMEAGAASAMGESLSEKEGVRAPEIIWPLTSRRVLTLDWIDGTPISNIAALDKQGIDRPALAVKVLQLFLTQALHEGFFHADMHQGNMMIDDKGDLILIDFGIMGRLDEAARATFAQIIHGFITRDYLHTAQMHFDAGYISKDHSLEAFAQALRAVGEPLFGRNADAVDMSRVLQQLFDVTDLFDMHLRPELILLQRTMVTVEGVARMLDPRVNMWEAATPIVKDYITNEIGPRRQVEKLRSAAFRTLELAPNLPDYVEKIAEASSRISEDRLALSKSSTDDLAQALSKESRMTRAALWFAGAGAILLAAVQFFG